MNKATLDVGQVADAMQQIDEAQAIIAAAMKGDPLVGSTQVAAAAAVIAVAAENAELEPIEVAPPVYVPAIDIAPSEELIDVVFSGPVSVYVQSSHREFAPGKTSITAGMYATIKQTHQADRVSRE